MPNPDDQFFDRADAHIDLSNAQIGDATKGTVSASMMYATARFNSWLTATGFNSADEMKEKHAENIEYFVDEFRKMLQENMDDYADNFAAYMKINADQS